jgi:mRNA-degrading endonuclease RelE of RelBE toxin-antitoxin system
MSEQPIEIKVIATTKFQKKVKSLSKRYRNIRDDVQPIIELLQSGELPGDRVSGVVDLEIYKVRVKNSDVRRGTSGGYRVIYYVKTSEQIILVTIYSKSEQEDIDASEVVEILAEFD